MVDLAGRVGRDYTTVSRQVARLEALGLCGRRNSDKDRRMREAEITTQGKLATDAVDSARERMAAALFSDREHDDFDQLIRLTEMLAHSLTRRHDP